jgi:hypothetical protein
MAGRGVHGRVELGEGEAAVAAEQAEAVGRRLGALV